MDSAALHSCVMLLWCTGCHCRVYAHVQCLMEAATLLQVPERLLLLDSLHALLEIALDSAVGHHWCQQQGTLQCARVAATQCFMH